MTKVIPPPSYSYDVRTLFVGGENNKIMTHASHLSRCSRLWAMALADPYTVMLSLPEWAHGPASTGILLEPYVLARLGEIFPDARWVCEVQYEMIQKIGPYEVRVVGTPDALETDQKILVEIKTTTSELTTHKVARGDVPWPWLIQLGVYHQLVREQYGFDARLYTACYSTTTGEIYVNEHDTSNIENLLTSNYTRLQQVFDAPEVAKKEKCDDFWGSCLCNVLGGKKIRLQLNDYDEGDDREVARLLDIYLDNAAEIDELNAKQQEIREKLTKYIPIGASLNTDEAIVSHHTQSSKRCNYELLQAKAPDLYKEVITVTESPRLTIRRRQK